MRELRVTNSNWSSEKLRILIFNWRDLAHPLAGGAEVYTHRVAEEWIKMGHEVTLFCASVEGSPEHEEVKGLKIIRRGGKHSVYHHAKKFYKNEGRGNYDLVVDEVNTRPFGAPKWVDDVEVIALIHQVCREIWFYQTQFLIAFIGRYILEPFWLLPYRNVKVITVSQSSRESLLDYGLKKVCVIPEGNTISDPFPFAMKEKNPTFIFVGRLSKNKRPLEVLEAFKLVKAEIPNSKLWIIGSGPLETKLKKAIPSGVELIGRVSENEKLSLMSKSHALLMTSVREGWGLVVTEAATVGTISIAYDVAGLKDSVCASGGYLSYPNAESLAIEIIKFCNQIKLLGYPEVIPDGVTTWENVARLILAECKNTSDA